MWRVATILGLGMLGCTGSDTTDTTDTGEGPDPTDPVCDDPDSFLGDGGGELRVTEAATFCVTGMTTVAALEDLYRVTVRPGTYRWPSSDTTTVYRLPVCITDVTGYKDTLSLPYGSIERVTDGSGVTTTYTQPFGYPFKSRWLEFAVSSVGTSPPDAALDGLMARDAAGGSTSQILSICETGAGCVGLSPCATPQAGTDPETLTFDRGDLSLYIDVIVDGGIWIDEPRLLYRVSGTLDGTSFEQSDYYRLGYRYAAHGLDRELLVLFDAPIGTACGLAGRYGRSGKETLRTIDCDGTTIDELGSVVLTSE